MLTLPLRSFIEIQDKLGLSDEALGRKMFRGNIGAAIIGSIKTAGRPISPEIAISMIALEREHDDLAMAA